MILDQRDAMEFYILDHISVFENVVPVLSLYIYIYMCFFIVKTIRKNARISLSMCYVLCDWHLDHVKNIMATDSDTNIMHGLTSPFVL